MNAPAAVRTTAPGQEQLENTRITYAPDWPPATNHVGFSPPPDQIEQNDRYLLTKPSFRDRNWWRREAERTSLGDWGEIVALHLWWIDHLFPLESDFMRACREDDAT